VQTLLAVRWVGLCQMLRTVENLVKGVDDSQTGKNRDYFLFADNRPVAVGCEV